MLILHIFWSNLMLFRNSIPSYLCPEINQQQIINIMKRLRKLILALVILITTNTSYSTQIAVVTNPDSSRISHVVFEDVVSGSLFSVVDIYGNIIYNETINETGNYSRKLDLSNLPDSEYYFEIDDQDQIQIIPFIISENIATIMEENKSTIFKPEISVEDNMVYISKKLVGEQSMDIDIYYEDYDLAYSEKLNDVFSVSKVYDFSTSKRGKYIIHIKSEGRTFKNTIDY